MKKLMQRACSSRSSKWGSLCEGLEPRVMLSSTPAGPINLVASNVSSLKLPSEILTGTAIKGTFKAIIAEDAGNATGSTPISVVAFLRPAAGGADVSITPQAATVTNIGADQAKPATLHYVIPTTLAAGSYSLVVTVDPDNAVAETSEADNTLVLAGVLTAAAGHVDLSGTLSAAKLPATIAAGSKKSIPLQLVLANNGNIASTAGTATVVLTLHPASGTDVTLLTQSVKIPAIKNGKTGKVPAIPLQITSAVPSGAYTITATITPANAAIAPVTITGPSITVTGGTSPGPGTGAILLHGDTVTFTAGNNGGLGIPGVEAGSFVTDTGATGTYSYGIPGILTLAYSTGDEQTLFVAPTGAQTAIDDASDAVGTKYLFNTVSTGAAFDASTSIGSGTASFLHLIA